MAIGLFIDGAFLMKSYPGRRINFVGLVDYLEDELNDHVDESYYFNADDNPPMAEDFFSYLRVPRPNGPGFRTKIYWLQRRELYWPARMGGGQVVHPDSGEPYVQTIQKAVDVGLIFHMTSSFHRRGWDKLVLIAGDSDFHEPVRSLVENNNVNLNLVGTRRSISNQLSNYARRTFEVDQEPLLSVMAQGEV